MDVLDSYPHRSALSSIRHKSSVSSGSTLLRSANSPNVNGHEFMFKPLLAASTKTGVGSLMMFPCRAFEWMGHKLQCTSGLKRIFNRKQSIFTSFCTLTILIAFSCASMVIIHKSIMQFTSGAVWSFEGAQSKESIDLLVMSKHGHRLNRPLPVCAGADSFRSEPNCSSLCISRAKASIVSKFQPNWEWSHVPSCHRCGTSWQAGDSVFSFIDKIRGAYWGDVLDAGTGKSSFEWLRKSGVRSFTGVTASEHIRSQLMPDCTIKCSLIRGDWNEVNLLEGTQFDTVIADYLLGSVDASAPFFSAFLFDRLKRHVKPGGFLIAVGYEPFPERLRDSLRLINQSENAFDAVFDQTEAVLLQSVKVRDAAILLSGGRPFREYPAETYVKFLEQGGFEVQSVTMFPVVYGKPWMLSQLQVASDMAKQLTNSKLATGLISEIESLRGRIEEDQRFKLGLCLGADFVIIAKPKEFDS